MSNENQITNLAKLTAGRLFSANPNEFTDEEAAGAWALIDLLASVSKDRKEVLRANLLERAEKEGAPNEKGSYIATFGELKVIKEKRVAKLPDEKVVEAELKAAGIDYEEAFTSKTTWAMDPSKVEFLAKAGKLPVDKLEDSKKVTWALKVRPSGPIKDYIDETKKSLKAQTK